MRMLIILHILKVSHYLHAKQVRVIPDSKLNEIVVFL